MYLYYEHHRDASGKVVLTELRLSSFSDGRLAINFKRTPLEEPCFKTCVQMCKWPPLANYSYDPNLKLWSYFGQYGISSTYGEEVIKKIQSVVEALGERFKVFQVEDLADQCVNNYVELNSKARKPKMSAEEFFYNHGVSAAVPALDREQVQVKLKVLLATDTVDKKSYRAAALKYHPDRNHGDGAKMSELNMLWQLWQQFEKQQTVTV